MEQEAEPTVVSPSGGDHHIVDIQLQPDAAQCVSGSHPPPPTSGNVCFYSTVVRRNKKESVTD
jgi:hypothetical protein